MPLFIWFFYRHLRWISEPSGFEWPCSHQSLHVWQTLAGLHFRGTWMSFVATSCFTELLGNQLASFCTSSPTCEWLSWTITNLTTSFLVYSVDICWIFVQQTLRFRSFCSIKTKVPSPSKWTFSGGRNGKTNPTASPGPPETVVSPSSQDAYPRWSRWVPGRRKWPRPSRGEDQGATHFRSTLISADHF